MRLQDLRDDLTFHEANKFSDPLNPCVVAARRVADLYQECPCERCQGTAPSESGFALFDDLDLTHDQAVAVLLRLLATCSARRDDAWTTESTAVSP